MMTVTAVGNLAADPELSEVNGREVANFRIGVRTGKDQTSWVNCACWGARAKTIGDYFAKGSRVTVTGKGNMRTFQKKDGTEGTQLSVDVQDFTLPERAAKPDPSELPF
jgi:single-strand DNA-binding protein